MLPKHYRLIKGSDFVEVLRKGQRVRGDFLDLAIKKTTDGYPRVGFLVTRKIAKQAAARNKLKRQMRAAVRHYIGGMRRGVVLALIARETVSGKTFLEIKAEVERIFKKGKILT
jgi:ribonuclease P protein component